MSKQEIVQKNKACPMVSHTDYYCTKDCKWYKDEKCAVEIIANSLETIASLMAMSYHNQQFKDNQS